MSLNANNTTYKTYEEYRDYFLYGLINDLKELCPDIDIDDNSEYSSSNVVIV
jgi:hypothetical protein